MARWSERAAGLGSAAWGCPALGPARVAGPFAPVYVDRLAAGVSKGLRPKSGRAQRTRRTPSWPARLPAKVTATSTSPSATGGSAEGASAQAAMMTIVWCNTYTGKTASVS